MREALDTTRGTVDFFFRDDDAGWDDDRLFALLEVFAAGAAPVDLAVIPRALTDALARRLCAWAASVPEEVRFHQHGFAHVNHEPAGRKYEFGPSRETRLQWRDIAEGRDRLHELMGSVDPIFTPPWNRCTRETGACLAELGIEVLSREASAGPLGIPGLRELPINVDWFAHRKHVRFGRGEFADLLARTVEVSSPVGIMFHHAAMDGLERKAAGDLLALIAHHPRARMRSMFELAPDQVRL